MNANAMEHSQLCLIVRAIGLHETTTMLLAIAVEMKAIRDGKQKRAEKEA